MQSFSTINYKLCEQKTSSIVEEFTLKPNHWVLSFVQKALCKGTYIYDIVNTIYKTNTLKEIKLLENKQLILLHQQLVQYF